MTGEIPDERFGIRHGERLGVPHPRLPLGHLRQEPGHDRSVVGIARHIHPLVGIVGEVEELAMIHRRIANELPPFIAYGTHESQIRQEDRVADALRLAGPKRAKVRSGQPRRHRSPSEAAERWEQVEEVGESCRGAAGRNARSGDDERASHAMLIHALLAQQPMAAEGEAVIGRVDDDRVGRMGGFREGVQDPANLRIQVLDESVIFSQLIAHLFRRARPRQQVLVAQDQLAVVEGVLRQVIARQGWTLGRISHPPRLGRIAGIMRRGEGHIRQEGLPTGRASEEIDGLVGELLTGELRGRLTAGEFPVRLEVLDGGPGMVIHSAEVNRSPSLEAAQEGRLTIVPLPGGKGFIALPTQVFRKREGTLQRVGQTKPSAPTHEHGPTRNAHRSAVASEAVVAPKTETPRHQTVQMRRADVRIAPGADRVRPLIISEEEHDVGSHRRGRSTPCPSGGNQNEQQRHHHTPPSGEHASH